MIKIIHLPMCLVNCRSFGANGHYCPKLYSVIEIWGNNAYENYERLNLVNKVRLETISQGQGGVGIFDDLLPELKPVSLDLQGFNNFALESFLFLSYY